MADSELMSDLNVLQTHSLSVKVAQQMSVDVLSESKERLKCNRRFKVQEAEKSNEFCGRNSRTAIKVYGRSIKPHEGLRYRNLCYSSEQAP